MNGWNRFRASLESHADVCLDFIRIYLGIGLFLKGLYFATHTGELMHMMENAGNLWFEPAIIGHYIIVAHLVGGLLLTIGLLTRLAAIVQVPILLGAVFFVSMPGVMDFGPRQHLEFSALVLFLMLLIFLYGAGRFSVDNVLARKAAKARRSGAEETALTA
jgi:uncharacterized membrane protein YphA (DoxX/SURF4 family)